MSLYKHYSFDLWLTLIRSNPLYKKERANFFYKHYNFLEKSSEEVNYLFRQVDVMCNAINEKTGNNMDAEEMYLMVISLVNENRIPLTEIDTASIYREMEDLLWKYPPFVYCNETSSVLEHLKQKKNTSISILSNTGFIKGITLRKVLSELKLDSFFDFQLYSDETGFSKPNKKLFEQLFNAVSTHRNEVLQLNEILHIGDNPVADKAGAEAAGIDSLLINSNAVSIVELIK